MFSGVILYKASLYLSNLEKEYMGLDEETDGDSEESHDEIVETSSGWT